MAFQDDFLETTMFGARGHIPQMLTVALVGGDGRPLGVSNSVVFWETQMASPPVQPPPHCLPLWANLRSETVSGREVQGSQSQSPSPKPKAPH